MPRTLAAALILLGPIAGAMAEPSLLRPSGHVAMPHTRPVASDPGAGAQGALDDEAGATRARTGPTDDDPALAELYALIEEARRAQAANDQAGARARIAEAIDRALGEIGERDDAAALGLLASMASFARDAGEVHGAVKAWKQVLAARSRSSPEGDRELQTAQQNLALLLYSLGDVEGARALFAKLVEARVRTLPEDDADLQWARGSLAVTTKALGDLAGARVLEEQVLAVRSRMLPEDHLDLQIARVNLAATLFALGDLDGARALQEPALAVLSRTLPENHANLDWARASYAHTIKALGDLAGARAIEEQVLAIRSRTLPEDDAELQAARANLAATLYLLGDLDGARALLEQALAVLSRTRHGDHPDLQAVRGNLAAVLKGLGDLAGARTLEEHVLDVFSRTLPEEHPNLQSARANLSITLKGLGDLRGARELEERVLEVCSRTLPADHSDLQTARLNLAWTVAYELALLSRDGKDETKEEMAQLSERCAQLITAMSASQTNTARVALVEASAREAEERCERLVKHLGTSLSFADGLGAFEPIRGIEPAAFILGETTRGAALTAARLARRGAGNPRWSELREQLRARSDEIAGLVQAGATSEGFRRALERREEVERELAALARKESGGTPVELDFDVATLAHTLGEHDAVVAYRRYDRWRLERFDAVAHADRARFESLPVASQAPLVEVRGDSVCAFVVRGRHAALDGRADATSGAPSSKGASRESSAAPSTPPESVQLTRIELGPIAPIEEAVRLWRGALGSEAESGRRAVVPGLAESESVRESELDRRGRELRRLLYDPLRDALDGADHVVVALDDVLHLVPLDALPLTDDSQAPTAERLGDRLRFETRVTLTELLAPRPSSAPTGELVVVGGVAYGPTPPTSNAGATADVAEESTIEPDSASDASGVTKASGAGKSAGPNSHARRDEEAGVPRESAWSVDFPELPATDLEARSIARDFEVERPTEGAVTLLRGSDATRERLFDAAPRATWLHIATHGWFASESIRSWGDPEPLDAHTGLGRRLSGEEQVKGMSPMLLCGLALAGANLPENEVGRVPGLITAEEIAALDLGQCELAVLSACDTNIGVRRAGQGVASLQKALQMAGARSVITSLWKVPDDATRELMTDFYRRIWVEKKSKHQALWEAKRKLRDAVDDAGQPKYSTRDWAAWVLTGEQE